MPSPEKAPESPSFAAFIPSILATAIISISIGYWIGARNSRVLFPSSKKQHKRRKTSNVEIKNPSEASSEECEVDLTDNVSAKEECKLVLVVRTDLGMTKGKVAAQCSHATLACYKSALKHIPKMIQRWEIGGQAKVTLQCKSEDELLMLQAAAMSLNLTAKVIHDAGRTQIAAGSPTVLGIGPAPKSVIDQVTGQLKLY